MAHSHSGGGHSCQFAAHAGKFSPGKGSEERELETPGKSTSGKFATAHAGKCTAHVCDTYSTHIQPPRPALTGHALPSRRHLRRAMARVRGSCRLSFFDSNKP